MLKSTDLDSTTKNVVYEIMRECTNKGVSFYDNFLIYFVKLLMLDPSWGVNSDCLPNRNDVQNFIKLCVSKLENQGPQMTTLKMQLYFNTNFENINNMILRNRIDLKARLSSLEMEILETHYDSTVDLNKVAKKIIYLITLYSGLGNPTINMVYKEAEAALSSIFLETDLKSFLAQTRSQKELQLIELTELVTGIRLFNKDCNKGGAGIEDLPKILNQAIEITSKDIQNNVSTIIDNVYMLTTAIDRCFEETMDEHGFLKLSMKLPDGIDPCYLDYIIELLITYRQYELYLRKISVEVNNINERSKEICKEFGNALLQIHETVHFRIAIPTIQVFPLFTNIAHIWCQLQDQTIALSQLNQMCINLQMQTKEFVPSEEIVKSMVGPDGPLTDAQRIINTTGLTIASDTTQLHDDIIVFYPHQIGDFEKLNLQYLGFCPWKFVETKGGLIPGNPNMGIARVLGKYYAFSSPQAAQSFGKDPIRYILRGLDLVRTKLQLINFLDLEGQLMIVREIPKLVSELPKIMVTSDVETQTDLHTVPSRIDSTYKWNIWDWKCQAINFANLSKCLTDSSQTHKSCAWNAAGVQTTEKKNVLVQTKKDNYSNVPTMSNFIYGLRGRKDDIQHIVTLTRAIEE